jgi:hypothetical protein
MNAFVAVLKRLRDIAAAKLAAQPVDIQPDIRILAKDNVVTLKPKRKSILDAIASAGDYADDISKPSYSQPLVYTHNTGGSGVNINDEYTDARWRDEATENYRADARKTTWRDTNSQLPRRDRGAP